MFKHTFNDTILRSYDIRGIYGKTLTEKDAFMLGFFFGIIVREKNPDKRHPLIIIGMDGRLSSPVLEKNLNDGLENSGCKIYRIGLGPTPMLYFASNYYEADGAIQVTGSHNPKDYNGFKIVLNQKSFFGENIQKLGHFARKGFSKTYNGFSKSVAINSNYVDEIIKPLRNIEAKLNEKTIVWDCGNGSSGPSVEMITKKIPGKHIVLYSEVNGNFPNHHPDPTDESTLKILVKKMKEVNAELGIAFDGDGDRIGVVDKQGRPIPGDLLTAFLANSITTNDKKNQTIILDIKSSYLAYKNIISLGFKVEIGKTGHSNIKKRLKELKSPLAGEMSGHIFFGDTYFGYDDALYAAIRLLTLTSNNIELDKFISTLPKTFVSPEIKVFCSDKKKFLTIDNISKNVFAKYNSNDVITIDGLRVKNNHGWWLIRASNTEEALVVRFEGKSEKDKKKLFLEVKNLLKNEGLTLDNF